MKQMQCRQRQTPAVVAPMVHGQEKKNLSNVCVVTDSIQYPRGDGSASQEHEHGDLSSDPSVLMSIVGRHSMQSYCMLAGEGVTGVDRSWVLLASQPSQINELLVQ
jgi:hypothetical protein